MKDKNQNLIALVIFLMAVGFVLYVAVAKGEPIPESKTYTNYNPVAEVSQERLDDWRNLAQKTAKQNFERSDKVETLEGQIQKAEAENTRLHNKLNTSRAVKRTPAKSAPQKNFTGNVEQWRPLVAKYFPASQVNNALTVMKGESGGNPNAVNDNPRTGDYSVGLFQINLYGNLANSRPSEAWLKVPENNIAYASRVWKSQGWSPWSYARKIGL